MRAAQDTHTDGGPNATDAAAAAPLQHDTKRLLVVATPNAARCPLTVRMKPAWPS